LLALCLCKELWTSVSVWTGGQILIPAQVVSLEVRWNQQMQGRPKHIRRWVAAILIYMTPERVSSMLKHDMQLRVWVMRGGVEGRFS
jgi:hypothetical protein